MIILKSDNDKYGPFSLVTKLENGYLCDGIEYQTVVTGEVVLEDFDPSTEPVVIPVPETVSPRQIRQALTRVNLRKSVEDAIAVGDQDTKDWYEYATAFERTNSHVIAMGNLLGVSSSQLDDLWRLAGSL